MEQITVGQIISTVTLLATFIGAVGVIAHSMSKHASEWLSSGLKPIKTKLDSLSTEIRAVDMTACKNFLVRFLADVEQDSQIDEIERQRFYEIYEHYEKIGGNSYIKDKVDKLKKAGKL